MADQADVLNPKPDSAHVAFDTSGVSRLREILMPDKLKLVEYRNGGERVYYENDQVHTLSLYLRGGYETWRTDTASERGAPGCFCLMPMDSYSSWNVGEQQDFSHLYFSDDYLRRIALTTFDIDPRRVELPQLTFHQDPALEAIFRHSMLDWDWQGVDSTLAVEQGVQTLLVNLIRNLKLGSGNETALTGGLAPVMVARLKEFIDANLHRQISLTELATIAELSDYHFARMFRTSLARTPQQYITEQRIMRAKQQLTDPRKLPLAEIALACGFSSQSHFGRVFRQSTGVTPGRWRKMG